MTSRPTGPEIIEQTPTRSDDLARMRDLFDVFPMLSVHLARPEDARLVIDANVAIRDIRWIVKKRTNPQARTALQEAIASKTVVAFAPSYLDDEMQAKLAEISKRERIPLEAMLTAWRDYSKGIRFYEAKRPTSTIGTAEVADPKDMPYIETYTAVGAAAILTEDPHLARMGARTVHFELTAAMRDYARHASVELTLKWHGLILLTLGLGLIHQFIRVLRAGIQVLGKAPRHVQLLIGTILLGALLYRPTRERLLGALGAGWSGVCSVVNEAIPLLGDFTETAERAKTNARGAWNQLAPHVTARRVPLHAHVLAICMVAERPLTTDELVSRLQRAGVTTTSKSFRSYLRSVLRGHKALREVEPNRWSVIAAI